MTTKHRYSDPFWRECYTASLGALIARDRSGALCEGEGEALIQKAISFANASLDAIKGPAKDLPRFQGDVMPDRPNLNEVGKVVPQKTS
jgi:hypothetical protein